MIRTLGRTLLQFARVVVGTGAAYFIAVMAFPAESRLQSVTHLVLAFTCIFVFVVTDAKGLVWFENMTFHLDHFHDKFLVATFYFLSVPNMWLAIQQTWFPDMVCGVMASAACVGFGIFYQEHFRCTHQKASLARYPLIREGSAQSHEEMR